VTYVAAAGSAVLGRERRFEFDRWVGGGPLSDGVNVHSCISSWSLCACARSLLAHVTTVVMQVNSHVSHSDYSSAAC
jgi:hypothetical protein